MDLMRMSERDYWAEVARRPGMFVGRTTFAGLTGYLKGYDDHSWRYGGLGLNGWNEWLVARRGRDCNHGWDGQVLHLAVSSRPSAQTVPHMTWITAGRPPREQYRLKITGTTQDVFVADSPESAHRLSS